MGAVAYPMRVLIAGGFGFVGGRLGQHLQQVGHQIVLGSRRARKAPDWLPQADVVTTNWTDALALEQSCIGVDTVIQAAGMNAHDCAADPVGALEFNGLATGRLVAAASRAGVKRFVYLSTAHVYASPLTGRISEDACPRNLHPYATSHLAGENTVLSANQRGQIEGIVIRLSNAFGTPVNKNVNCWMLLVNDLCKQSVKTRKMVLHSSGLQQRDFISMLEVCRVMDHLVSCELVPGPFTIFNVGSGVSRSVLEIAQLVQQRCKSVLGFEPDLLRNAEEADEKNERLEYRVERLKKMGLTMGCCNNIEIDDLLRFCYAAYKTSLN